MSGANAHMQAWLTVLNTNLATMSTPRHAYDYDMAPQHGGDYLIAFLLRRGGGNPRNGSVASPSLWRLSIRSVGVGVTNARVLLDRANDAIEGVSITVNGIVSTPAVFEVEDAVREDERNADLWSGLRSYTYAF